MDEQAQPQESALNEALRGNGEIFFGVVGPIGAATDAVETALASALASTSTSFHVVNLIQQLRRLKYTTTGSPWRSLDAHDEYQRYVDAIDAGNAFCSELQRGDSLVAAAMLRVHRLRATTTGSKLHPSPRTAYLFRSLKRKEELKRLRSAYGAGFLLIAAHAPRQTRAEALATKIARSNQDFSPEKYRDKANVLIAKDEDENVPFGQEVRSIFKSADLFADARTERHLEQSIRRFVELIYGYPFHTPTRDELGMSFAHVASLRSADLARQVGAAILSTSGSLIAVGCNDVPRSGGGQYWPDDTPDYRDFRLRRDVAVEIRQTILEDVLTRLGKLGYLSQTFADEVDANVSSALKSALKNPLLKGARLLGALEYGRVVHAEMAALSDAAQNGKRVSGATLYTTTFPCHECTRHIIASGIRRVVFVEAYPKSLASTLFGYQVDVDAEPQDRRDRSGDRWEKVRFEQYVGISPRMYPILFPAAERRASDGVSLFPWESATSPRRVIGDPRVYIDEEVRAIRWLTTELEKGGLTIE